MKILFLAHIYKEKHSLLVKGISEVLHRQKCTVDHEPQESVLYDCILVLNQKALKKYKTVLQKQQAPVIYLFCLSDIAEEYIAHSVVTKTMIIKDKILNISLLFPRAFYLDMILPTPIPSKPTPTNEKPLLYIHIENDYLGEITFLKILPLLNQLDNYAVHYQSSKSIGRHLLNPHIKVIPHKQNIFDQISQADMVIGSGMIAALAVQQGKKTIVIGEKGYGGVVTDDHLEYHISNCFQGRNGGKFDEMVPSQLIVKAIASESNDAKRTIERLSTLQAINENKFIRAIEKMVSTSHRVRINDVTLKYMFNPDYSFIKKKKRVWLYKRVFGTLYKSINESEYVVVSTFMQPQSIQDALSMFPVEYKEHIGEYIQELITEKILLPVETEKDPIGIIENIDTSVDESNVLCPCCGRTFNQFMDYDYNRPSLFDIDRLRATSKNIVCPNCSSVPRHRIACYYFDTIEIEGNILMFAAEKSIRKYFDRNNHRYTTADLFDRTADLKIDIQAIELPDEQWDLITCNHVLEHVIDYKKALMELRRILKKGGILEITVPTDRSFKTVYEDTSVTTKEGRIKTFGQHDHLRIFGNDLEKILSDAGFSVEIVDGAKLPPKIVGVVGPAYYDENKVYICRKK